MPGTNVELSKNELELVINSEFILTKNRIIEKVYNLFGALSENYKKVLNEHINTLPIEVLASSPKIYKGENYSGLPYVMMDHPRVFLKDDVFAIRSFFWWGNYFSITLQLSGRFKELLNNDVVLKLQKELYEDYFICVNNSPWEHHFEPANYKPVNTINAGEVLNKSFFKIAAKLPLHKWQEAETFYTKNYSALINLIIEQLSYPGGGRVL